jgi:hypothetical protein
MHIKIDYELAKQMKDAGFPQHIVEGSFYWIVSPVRKAPRRFCWGGDGEDKPYGEYVLEPTLEELIEACGENIEALTHEHSHAGNSWVASAFHISAHGRGLTPAEAVARLWLALHKGV